MKKKIGLICLALVLALGAMGVGLAYWNETLVISGTVATGELDIEFVDDEAYPDCVDNEDEGALGFDVGTCEIVLSDGDDTEPGDSPGDMSKAVITVSNAYPSYRCTVWFMVSNNGSIPVHLKVIIVDPGSPELDVTISDDPTSTILAPGATVVFDVSVHVTDAAEELQTYTFSVEVLGEQFNAGPW